MAKSVCTIAPAPATTFHSPEPWEHIPLSPRLTQKNLSDLEAVLASLTVKNEGSPFPSRTPSVSSSDSESNHRLHTSSKKVCVREDLNTVRKIAPRRLQKPKPIDLPDIARSKAKWRKPDTPAPWHVFEADGNGAFADRPLRTPSDVGSPLRTAIPLRRSPLGPPSPLRSSKITIKRKRSIDSAPSSPLVDLTDPASAKTPLSIRRPDARPRIVPTLRRTPTCGIFAVRRLSQHATPRPRSLPMSPRSLPEPSPLSLNFPQVSLENPKSVAPSRRLSVEPGPSILMRSFAYDEVREDIDEPSLVTPSSWPPTEESSLLRAPAIEPSRPPRNYVDHVRNQRGMASPRKIVPMKEKAEMELIEDIAAWSRRRSSF